MKLNRLERELVANYIEEYVNELDYLVENIGALYKVYVMDEDTEVAVIERTLDMLRTKIKKIKKVDNKDQLKELVNLKKITKKALEKGGHYDRWD